MPHIEFNCIFSGMWEEARVPGVPGRSQCQQGREHTISMKLLPLAGFIPRTPVLQGGPQCCYPKPLLGKTIVRNNTNYKKKKCIKSFKLQVVVFFSMHCTCTLLCKITNACLFFAGWIGIIRGLCSTPIYGGINGK